MIFDVESMKKALVEYEVGAGQLSAHLLRGVLAAHEPGELVHCYLSFLKDKRPQASIAAPAGPLLPFPILISVLLGWAGLTYQLADASGSPNLRSLVEIENWAGETAQ